MSKALLKKRLLELLKEDEEFRLTVAGLLGYGELLQKMKESLQELAKLREDMIMGFKRHDEEFAKVWAEISKLREDLNRGFAALSRRLDALGARWGIMAENAFREGLRALLEDLGIRVERWSALDEEGRVYGYESVVELDVAVRDGELILVEITSHVKASDVAEFRRKADFYAEKTGRKPDKLLIVSPYADEEALKAAKRLGVEIRTDV